MALCSNPTHEKRLARLGKKAWRVSRIRFDPSILFHPILPNHILSLDPSFIHLPFPSFSSSSLLLAHTKKRKEKKKYQIPKSNPHPHPFPPDQPPRPGICRLRSWLIAGSLDRSCMIHDVCMIYVLIKKEGETERDGGTEERRKKGRERIRNDKQQIITFISYVVYVVFWALRLSHDIEV